MWIVTFHLSKKQQKLEKTTEKVVKLCYITYKE